MKTQLKQLDWNDVSRVSVLSDRRGKNRIIDLSMLSGHKECLIGPKSSKKIKITIGKYVTSL